MKILCFIDYLGSGGAQRQLVNLALGLKRKGHSVSFLIYHHADFYSPILKENDINIKRISASSYYRRVVLCRKYIRSNNFNAVISFLETPSLISELSVFPSKKWKLIVSERSSNPKILSTIRGRFFRFFHFFADYIVSNSHTNREMVKKANPFLKKRKNITIYNIYDFNLLDPKKYHRSEINDGKFHILVAASHQKLKNFENLALAISLLENHYKRRLVIDWYGNQELNCYRDNLKIVSDLNLHENIKFYPPTLDIYQKMIDADAVGLFSIYEGLSNTICEAMCLGRPVITTDVSDNREILGNDNLIADAASPESIAYSLKYLMDLSSNQLNEVGNRNRSIAQSLFDENLIIRKYLGLLEK